MRLPWAVTNARLDGIDKRFDDMNANMNNRFDEMAAMQRELIRAILRRTEGETSSQTR